LNSPVVVEREIGKSLNLILTLDLSLVSYIFFYTDSYFSPSTKGLNLKYKVPEGGVSVLILASRVSIS